MTELELETEQTVVHWDDYESDAFLARWNAAVENMITEDDEPMESFYAEKQMRLLVEVLRSSWSPKPLDDAPDEKRKFIAATNVGVFISPFEPPIVPDMFLSLDAEPQADWKENEKRSYCLWSYLKPPEVIVEIVSDKRGGEFSRKLEIYARMNVKYYVVFDPRDKYNELLTVFERSTARFYKRGDLLLPEVGLSLKLWQGEYEDMESQWLRWCDADGNLILSGKETIEKLKAELANLRSESK